MIQGPNKTDGLYYVKAEPVGRLGGRMAGRMPYAKAIETRAAWIKEGYKNTKIVKAE